ncbi:MAG: beta-lactamase family protein [Candidatus Marinimicrobia bacterium]|nr:beta-lactamase family protein [Candidatus Neomarinimicrobiota bacterium]
MNRLLHRASLVILLATVNYSCERANLSESPPYTASQKLSIVDELLAEYHEYGMFQGSVLIAAKSEIIYQAGLGLANLEWGIENTPKTKFRIASLGKAFTAALILQLVDEGRIDLHAPISKYLPDFDNPVGDQVTVHHLLSHSSGIPGVPQRWEDDNYREPYTMDQLVEFANGSNLEFEPGAEYRYSNNGYNLLGAIVENIAGKAFGAVLRERILDRLGMRDTGLILDHTRILSQMASGYNRLPGNHFENAPYQDEAFAVGAGGMYSTVLDLFKWNEGLTGSELLSDKSKMLMFTPGLGRAGYGWAVGVYVRSDQSRHDLIYGLGGTSGFASTIFRLPDDRIYIIILSNTRQTEPSVIASNITNVLVDIPPNPISPPE